MGLAADPTTIRTWSLLDRGFYYFDARGTVALATNSQTSVASPVKMPCTVSSNAMYSCQRDSASPHPWPSQGRVDSVATNAAASTVTVAPVAARWPASVSVRRK